MAKLMASVCGLIFSVLLATTAFAATVEVAESVPVETGLEVPGIRTTQQVWIDMINNAQSTIDLEEFYVDSRQGEALDPVLSAIWTAANRGVHVRLIVDLKFYKTYHSDPDKLAQVPNVEVKTIDFGSGVQHSKYFVVDQGEVYVGSANFDWLALTHIHEIGLHIADPGVAAKLESVFDKDWDAAISVHQQSLFNDASFGQPIPPQRADDPFLVVGSPAARNPDGLPDTLTAIVGVIDRAQHALRIQVYQYTTKPSHGSGRWNDLDSALRRAAERGVHVQLMVDHVALKNGSQSLAELAALPGIEVRVVTIPEWSGGHLDYARLIHSKYFTIDGAVAWVGTENWSENYFTASRNVGVLLQLPEIVTQLDQIFEHVWTSPFAHPMQR